MRNKVFQEQLLGQKCSPRRAKNKTKTYEVYATLCRVRVDRRHVRYKNAQRSLPTNSPWRLLKETFNPNARRRSQAVLSLISGAWILRGFTVNELRSGESTQYPVPNTPFFPKKALASKATQPYSFPPCFG